jgi:hypothetical protein
MKPTRIAIKLLDKLLGASTTVRDLANGLLAVADGLQSLAETVKTLASNQATHHQLIVQMWQNQQFMLHKMHENALDMNMPNLKKSKADVKPN